MRVLDGLRVLIIEDEPILSLNLQDMLADLGCVVAGTAARLEPALALAAELAFDIALLDANLAGRRADPVIDVVVGRGLPVVVLTGYSQDSIEIASGAPVVQKPYTSSELEQAIRQALG